MKVLHSAAMLSFSPGIYNQMFWENQAALNLGLNFTSKIFCPLEVYPNTEVVKYAGFGKPRNVLVKVSCWIKLRKEYFNWLRDQQKYFDVILLRYSVHDPFLLKFLNEAKVPVYLVHHTLELPELNSLNIVGKLRAILEKNIGNKCINSSYGIIAVTNEIKEFEFNRLPLNHREKPFYIYPNGILLKDNKILNDYRKEIPELLFVASFFSDWHGLDLILNNLKEDNSNFLLHIVGRVDDWQRDLAKDDKRVIFHGVKNNNQIHEIAERCWIGLSSFSLERKGMREACTLKVREYLSMGLPVYSGHKDIFPQEFYYYFFGNPDIASILAYARKMRTTNRIDVEKEANNFINKEKLLMNLYSYLDK